MGLGAALNSPCWHLRFRRLHAHEELVVEASDRLVSPDVVEAARAAIRCFRSYGVKPIGLGVEVAESIPAHVGLGSKTAFLKAVRAAYGLLAMGDYAALPMKAIGRGGTSGIGVNLSDAGGVVLDTGHIWFADDVMDTSRARVGAPLPDVLARYHVADGMLLLARMRGERGPHGLAESNIFRRALPLEQSEVDRVAGIILFEALPALATGNWAAFGCVLARLQQVGFKKEEWLVQSDATKRLAELASRAGAHCAALSSMGPTVAIIADDLLEVRGRLEEMLGDDVVVMSACVHNTGMEWTHLE